MKPWTDPENIKGLDEGLMVMAAFRYSIGRQSYIVGSCIAFLKRYWPTFEENVRRVITRDLKEEIQRDEDWAATGKSYVLGSDCDRRAWLGLRDWIAQQEVKK